MAEAFAERWARKERACGFEKIPAVMSPCGKDLLPNSAAPCLTFEYAAHPKPLWEVFGIPDHWDESDRRRLANYRMIGADGAGSPICIDQLTGKVVLLDHENWFRTVEFVNSSVKQLGECLLAYMGEHIQEKLRSELQQIDFTA